MTYRHEGWPACKERLKEGCLFIKDLVPLRARAKERKKERRKERVKETINSPGSERVDSSSLSFERNSFFLSFPFLFFWTEASKNKGIDSKPCNPFFKKPHGCGYLLVFWRLRSPSSQALELLLPFFHTEACCTVHKDSHQPHPKRLIGMKKILHLCFALLCFIFFFCFPEWKRKEEWMGYPNRIIAWTERHVIATTKGGRMGFHVHLKMFKEIKLILGAEGDEGSNGSHQRCVNDNFSSSWSKDGPVEGSDDLPNMIFNNMAKLSGTH